MSGHLVERIGEALQSAHRILLATHLRPDGDAIGSLVGLGLALLEGGKSVQMVLDDGLPAQFQHLRGAEQIRRNIEGRFDLAVALDCSDRSRLGRFGQEIEEWDLNIDHHVTNSSYARINLIEVEAVATAEIVATNLERWGFQISKSVADALLLGILTDTIGFRTHNMRPDVLRLAAKLMDAGGDLPNLYARYLYQKPFEAVKMWGSGLSRLRRKNGLVWTVLTNQDRSSAGYPGKDDADMINLLSAIEDAQISVVFVEQPNGKVKVSWRAVPGLDVSQIAVHFGGGGHPAAAGAELSGDLQELYEAVLEKTYLHLEANQKDS
ncbi:MAG: DHH family phosphoesterase [Anaerolineales bacterium]|nr:DHH family phosphoesterase [Anaerolineales bacterium]MCS7246802.1 DHH family phosphoesterase [Anaerolineales bacterium]MDW8160612.1 DHH family phosphoesterase [Anaerolineales bacterium]MDW8447594.1 DHH family phosphoesterase [Anaerolineales bacterium]